MTSCRPEDTCCQSPSSCCGGPNSPSGGPNRPGLAVIGEDASVCCGSGPSASGLPDDKPGYRLWGFVEGFIESPAGPVPRVRGERLGEDRRGTVLARLGIGRDSYGIAPGLYAIGTPDESSPVTVTANYKLSFDVLRSFLAGVDAWILAVDTRGINVWCAAGKGTFSARAVAERVKAARLEKIVNHRRLILPQLSATGVSARQVKTLCGFEVIWGPVHARDIGLFIRGGMRATPAMRRVTFTLWERTELIPVDLNHVGKPTLYVIPALFLLSGFGPGLFSVETAIARGLWLLAAYLLAVTVGAILAPVLLPWLPGRAFALKGAAIGAAAGALLAAGLTGRLSRIEMLALSLFIMAVSSYLAMNFTGSTPFTSPTGVEKEMRRAMPVQAIGVLAAVILWVSAGFTG